MDVVSFACNYSSHVVCLPFVQINLFTLPFALSEFTFVFPQFIYMHLFLIPNFHFWWTVFWFIIQKFCYYISSLLAGYFACSLICPLNFFKINFYKKLFQESWSLGPDQALCLSCLIWVQRVWKCYQQTTLTGKELSKVKHLKQFGSRSGLTF